MNALFLLSSDRSMMNSEQLQEWLTELNCLTKDEMARLESPEACSQFLQDNGESTEILMDYLARNYADQDLTEPIFGQILSGYYRGGLCSFFGKDCVGLSGALFVFSELLAKVEGGNVQ